MPGAGPAGAAKRSTSAHVFVADLSSPALGEEDAHHLIRVLRLRPGETVGVSDGRGGWRSCRVVGSGQLEAEGPPVTEEAPWPPVTVGLAVPKGDRADWAVQKLTEVGVDRIVVLSTARSVVRWEASRATSILQRLRRVTREAAAQSRRVWVPEVSGVVGLDALGGPGVALAEPGGPPLDPGVTGIAVGPEGGWAPEELALGWPIVGLGAHVLRAETAALAAGVLLGARRAGTVGRIGR